MLLSKYAITPKMHLRQPGFAYSPWGPLIQNKQKTKI